MISFKLFNSQMLTMVMVMISNPQTALGNHMESLGRTLLEKVAEVGEQ